MSIYKSQKIILGKMVQGLKLGREIGYPTINCKIESIKGNIPYGVYTCYLIQEHESHNSIMHYGTKSIGNPDGKNSVHCEIHVIDFDNFINKNNVKVKVLNKIRNVKEFKNQIDLKKQIENDICIAKKFFNHD